MAEALERAGAMTRDAFIDLALRFVNMDVDGDFALFSERQHLRQPLVVDRIRRVRGETEAEQRLVHQFVSSGHALGKVVIDVCRVGRREVGSDEPD